MSKEIQTSGLYTKIADLINAARQNVVKTVNQTMVYTYFEIGRMILEDEQHGKKRAEYGKQVLKELSAKLSKEFGKGFSVDNLQNMRQFYMTFSNYETTSRNFILSWSHYLKLMRIENRDERSFYEIECAANNWSLKELQRQFNSALYERLVLSRDKKGVKQLSEKGQVIEKPADILKDPYILEFLNLPEHYQYSESELEKEIIDKLENFLLELGKGFTFVGRQVRFTFDEKHFKVDLVFFNRILRSFVVIDLKIGELAHQDIGQMQMYVNYYDRFVRLPDENKTVGIVLCKDKSETLVEITLPEDNNTIFASRYKTVLPDKQDFVRLLEQ
ncbi:MAG TPA: PDDEXK nuclease domain-containing protein [bacterium]|nr:PDDEXK nuclease domain-containing protein [bacterium]HPY15500.1 PDDEXK nuclease domain-containing protein [bacterium]HQB09600.1 PDDEXK nuclease domain-containing protein [bacterium]